MKDLYKKLLGAPNHYVLLGVHAGCTEAELKTAHRTLAAMLHPDRNPDPEARECMSRVNVAYEKLLEHGPAYTKGLRLTPGAVKCPECGGKGYSERGRGFKGATVRARCPACAGVGVTFREAL